MDFTPINIICEPIYDERIPVPCYYTNQIHLAERSYIGKNIKGKQKIFNQTVRQCPHCVNVFAKNHENMRKHA